MINDITYVITCLHGDDEHVQRNNRRFVDLFVPAVDCPNPNCSGHGVCVEGNCICKKGWKGVNCNEMDKDALQCLPDCSGHGTFDLEAQTCECEPMWSGDDCSKGMKKLIP